MHFLHLFLFFLFVFTFHQGEAKKKCDSDCEITKNCHKEMIELGFTTKEAKDWNRNLAICKKDSAEDWYKGEAKPKCDSDCQITKECHKEMVEAGYKTKTAKEAKDWNRTLEICKESKKKNMK